MQVTEKLKEFFSLDYRSLALMRIAMGVLIILDLIERASSLVAHYSDQGVLSRASVLADGGSQFFISIHNASGLAAVQAGLFGIAGIFALMLIFGYRTRLATIVSWLFLISLQARNPLVLQGGDILFRAILFWMMFLPTGARWSLDRILNRIPQVKNTVVFSAATIAYMVQIIILYVSNGILKTGIAWHDGTAVYYALSVDQLARPLGEIVRGWRGVCHALTYVTRYLELYGSLLFFIPVETGLMRLTAVVLFALMQIGFNSTMHLGYFGAISIVASLGLLPTYFWDRCMSRFNAFFVARARTGLSIYYDQDCGFCSKMVVVIKNVLLLSNSTRITPAQTDPAMEKLMLAKNSWVVVDRNGTPYFGFRALARAVSYSPLFAWKSYLMRLPIVSHIGEYAYRKVAASRLAVCLPEKEDADPRAISSRIESIVQNAIVIFFLAFVILWNAGNIINKNTIPNKIHWIAWVTRLDQNFNMFSPTPLTEDGWYVIPATLRDGRVIDIFKDGPMLTGKQFFPVSYAKPKHIADSYPNQRWQKYLMNIAERDNNKYRLEYGQYLCRTWNENHSGEETLETFEIDFMIETTPPEGQLPTPPQKTDLWNHHCF